MQLLSSPKVRLALIVNGLYFISLVMPTTPHTRPRLFARAGERLDARAPKKTTPAYTPLAPPSAEAPKAAVNYVKDFDQLDVFLSHDLTLVRLPGHTLLLSPTFTTKMSAPEQPRSVLLRFVSYSQQQALDAYAPFVITADGTEVWRSGEGATGGAAPYGARPLHSVASDEAGRVIETFGQEIPYDLFLDVISARRVIVELGDDRVELNADQVEALRDMHRRLPQPSEEPPPPNKTGRVYGLRAEADATKVSHDRRRQN
jgi:hypothetical protein